MLHRDTVGNAEEITATRLMMMNAGHTFQHEGACWTTARSRHCRSSCGPRAADLGPKVQFHDFGEVLSHGKWRLIAGPEGAPLEVRAQAWVSDAHVAARAALSLPPLPAPDAVRLLHVFGGDVEVGGLTLRAGDTALPQGGRREGAGRLRRRPRPLRDRSEAHRFSAVACSAGTYSLINRAFRAPVVSLDGIIELDRGAQRKVQRWRSVARPVRVESRTHSLPTT